MPSPLVIFSLLLVDVIALVVPGPSGVIVPCKKSDEVCMTKSANIAAPIIAAGIPSLGVDGFEPARVKEISGLVSKFKFNFTDNSVAGYTKCTISDVKLKLDEWNLKFDVRCPLLVLTGHLTVSGELLDVPVEGDDDYKLDLEKYLIKVDVDIAKVKGADERDHLVFTTFRHIGIPQGPFKFHYNNFKAKKALSQEAAAAFDESKFLRAVVLATDTYINKLYKDVMFKTVNMFFRSVPFEDLFID